MINLKLPYRFLTLDGMLILNKDNVIQYHDDDAGQLFESHLRDMVINQSMFLGSIHNSTKVNNRPMLNPIEFNRFADIARQHWNETCPNAF